jgi:type III secretion system YscQ/HrcQ family protein
MAETQDESTTERIRVPRTETEARGPRPYSFDGLEKMSCRQLLALRRLELWLPDELWEGEVPAAVRQALRKIFDADVQIELDSIRAFSPGDLEQLIPDPTLLAVFSPRLGVRALLEVELALAHAAVDLMLGAVGESAAARPLTDIELGVLSYVLLEASRAFAPPVAEGGLGRLRLAFKVVIGSAAGYLRFVLPEEVLEAGPNPSPAGAARRARRMRSRLARISGVEVPLRAEIGSGELTLADLSGLRVGDVFVVGSLALRPDRGEAGQAVLKVGPGRAGGFEASVELVNGCYQATLERFAAPAPRAGEQIEEERELRMAEEAQNAEGEKLLGDLPLEVVVELARVSVSAEQVLELHAGSVIDLGRGTGDSVTLSVHGRLVARGALVEIEGRLGVRITSLSR